MSSVLYRISKWGVVLVELLWPNVKISRRVIASARARGGEGGGQWPLKHSGDLYSTFVTSGAARIERSRLKLSQEEHRGTKGFRTYIMVVADKYKDDFPPRKLPPYCNTTEKVPPLTQLCNYT